jgi:dipeptidyl aminopeptidase/acylaminoacyl peptidase
MHTLASTLVALNVLLLVVADGLHGQVAAPVPPEALLNTKKFAEYQPLRFSPDGKSVIYALRDIGLASPQLRDSLVTGVPWFGAGSTLWVTDTVTGRATRLIDDPKTNSWLASWSPDGQYVAFFSNRGTGTRAELWIKNMRDDRARKVSDAAVRPQMSVFHTIQWTPDGRQLLVLVYPQDITGEQLAQRVLPPTTAALSRDTPGTTVKLLDSTVDKTGDSGGRASPWNLDVTLGGLALVDVSTGRLTRVCDNKLLGGYWMSPDGRKIAFAEYLGFERPGSQQILYDLRVYERKTGRATVVASHIRLSHEGGPVEWLPNSTTLSFRSSGPDGSGDVFTVDIAEVALHKWTNLSPESRRVDDRDDDLLWDATGDEAFFTWHGGLWRLTLSDNKISVLTKLLHHHIAILTSGGDRVWSTDEGRSIIVLAVDAVEKKTGFYRIDIGSGRPEMLWETDGMISSGLSHLYGGLTISPDGTHVVYTAEDAQHPSDLWINESTFRTPRRLTHINPQLDGYVFGAARLVSWRSADGQPLQGALLLPAGYKNGQKCPVVVWVYPGVPQSNALYEFGFLDLLGLGTMQLLATRGYAVFFPDTPTRTGTASADLLKDILPGVERVIELGIADPERVGVMGHSAGSYAALALLAQTTRFRAAFIGGAYADLISSYGSMSPSGAAFGTSTTEGGGITGMGGTPWQVRDRYIENSPVFYFDRIQVPVFIFQGVEDQTVPVHLADEIFVDLRRLGKTVSYARYFGEDHSPASWKTENRLDLAQRMIGWFDKYLKAPE